MLQDGFRKGFRQKWNRYRPSPCGYTRFLFQTLAVCVQSIQNGVFAMRRNAGSREHRLLPQSRHVSAPTEQSR